MANSKNMLHALTTIDVIDGVNCCILAYGQIGTGKTYSLFGNREDDGLIERILKAIFYSKEVSDQTINISLQHIEIYRDKVSDLFNRTSSLHS
jgi:hypothetical protein